MVLVLHKPSGDRKGQDRSIGEARVCIYLTPASIEAGGFSESEIPVGSISPLIWRRDDVPCDYAKHGLSISGLSFDPAQGEPFYLFT